jgi:hydrogenase-4 component F
MIVGFGLGSMLLAGALLLRQRNYKRMLAYSSIEHMGILAVGCGLGPAAAFGALLHMIGSSLAKALLFFVSGNVLIEYRSKRIGDVSGLIRRLPASGALFVLGFLALTGTPPFAPFMSEVVLLRGAVAAGRPWVALAFVAIQIVIFVGLVTRIVRMAQGGLGTAEPRRESVWLLAPPAGLLVLVLVLGVYLAPPLERVLRLAAGTLGGSSP